MKFSENDNNCSEKLKLLVKKGIWFGFKGLHESDSIIMNVADIEHNPNEVLRKSVNEFKYDW